MRFGVLTMRLLFALSLLSLAAASLHAGPLFNARVIYCVEVGVSTCGGGTVVDTGLVAVDASGGGAVEFSDASGILVDFVGADGYIQLLSDVSGAISSIPVWMIYALDSGGDFVPITWHVGTPDPSDCTLGTTWCLNPTSNTVTSDWPAPDRADLGIIDAHAFTGTYQSVNPSGVTPEPSTFGLLGAGVAAILAVKRHKRTATAKR